MSQLIYDSMIQLYSKSLNLQNDLLVFFRASQIVTSYIKLLCITIVVQQWIVCISITIIIYTHIACDPYKYEAIVCGNPNRPTTFNRAMT